MTSSQNKAAMQVHLPQWQASQLSQAAYCKRHNLKPHIFSYYKNKLSESRASAEQASPFIPVKLTERNQEVGQLDLISHQNLQPL